jgi:hypothetical protein
LPFEGSSASRPSRRRPGGVLRLQAFALLPPTKQHSDGTIELLGFKVTLVRVGPGLLFAALGIVVVLGSLFKPLSYETSHTSDASGKTSTKKKFSGAVDLDLAVTPLPVEQSVRVLADLACLKQLSRIPGKLGFDAVQSLDLARKRVILANWQPSWGDPRILDQLDEDAQAPVLPPELFKLVYAAPEGCPEK